MAYAPIGPYVAGLIELFDPSDAEDRDRADDIFCPSGGCDVSLRIIQGGVGDDTITTAGGGAAGAGTQRIPHHVAGPIPQFDDR